MGALSSLAFTAGASAQEQHVHEHGVGQLNLAIDGELVELELAAPGADIVGFEHEPATAAEKEAFASALAKLKNGAALFMFPDAAKCRLDEARVESEDMSEEQHEEEHRHESAHEKDDHDEAGHQKGEADKHAEFHVHYRFRCADAEQLTYIDVSYFNAFPAARELEVQALTPRGQKGGELTAASPRLTF